MAELIITAPIAGWAAPLSEVPDPVFAEAMMGDGVAIHPTSTTVHAPCSGTVAALHAAQHAVTIRTIEGAEILVHLGLETVALGGKGLRALVAEGATVSRGDPLIAIDLDAVAQAAKSLVTPVVVVNSDAFRIERRVTGASVAAGDPLMTLVPIAVAQTVAAQGETLTRNITIPLAHGIHARPAARIGELARGFDAQVEIVHGDRRANVRSAVALMGLALVRGDAVRIEARGRDAAAALAAIGNLIESGMGEAAEASPPALAAPVEAPKGALAGIAASPGLAIGPAAWLRHTALAIAQDADDPAAESAALDGALARVRTRIEAVAGQGSEAQRNILQAHIAFLDDADLLATAHAHIAEGRSAGFGWNAAISAQTATLRATGNPRFAERAADLEDLERQVQHALAGTQAQEQDFAPGTILLAEDLLPSQLIGLDGNIVAVALAGGGPTSHVAILAAARGLPMLVATGPALADIAPGTPLVLDADAGLLHLDPADTEAHRQRLTAIEARKAAALAAAHDPCRTADGTRIELFANLGSVEDATRAVELGAEGSGLLRTEFLFLDRNSAPSEAEQSAAYQAISDAMAGRPVIVRLLDIGGDKPAPWLPIAPEKNPMLGQRGIRVSLAHPELLDAQLRAILQVRGDCRIMVPMVSGLAELRAVRAAMDRIGGNAQLGVMIETPAAAMIADLIAAEADFLSIGTNDLTQYTLAMDRENATVAAGVDALHPAVLRLIAMTCQGGMEYGRTVGVCGSLASDRQGIPLLIGLGVTELSATSAFVPEAKALVRRLDLAACQKLAAEALGLGSPQEIRALVRASIEEAR